MGTDLDTADFIIIMKWFEFKFARDEPDKIPLEDRRAFWKLTFLSEQKHEDDALKWSDDDDEAA